MINQNNIIRQYAPFLLALALSLASVLGMAVLSLANSPGQKVTMAFFSPLKPEAEIIEAVLASDAQILESRAGGKLLALYSQTTKTNIEGAVFSLELPQKFGCLPANKGE